MRPTTLIVPAVSTSALVLAGLTATPPAAAAAADCTYAAIQTAVATDATLVLDCSAPIVFPAPIAVNAPRAVTLSAAPGRTVVLSGGGTSRLFTVDGGALTLSGVTIVDAEVRGGTGTAGGPGLSLIHI